MNNIQGKYIGFWSNRDEYGFLSNWYRCTFKLRNVTFTSSEQAMMYLKARLFHDDTIALEILKTDDPRDIKQLGRQVSNFNESIWDKNKFNIMLECLEAKFKQNTDLKNKLLQTDGYILVEASPYDKVWGIGLSVEDDITDESTWRGQNLLGKALMNVRELLRK